MCAEPAVSPVEDPLLSPLLGGGAGFPQGHLEPGHPSGHAAWLPGPPKGAPLGPAVPLVPVLVPGFPGGSNASREAALQCLPLLCVRLSAVLRWLFEFWISAFFVRWPFAVQSSVVSFLWARSAFVPWGLGLPNSLASVMFHGKVFEGRLCSLSSSYLFPSNSLKRYQHWIYLSIVLPTYSGRGTNLLDPCPVDQPLLLSLSLNFSLKFLLACSAVLLGCSWRGIQRHDLVSVQYFISFGILCIFKYRFSFYRIKYFWFKGLLKHVSLSFYLRLTSWSAQGCRSELTSGSFSTS